MNHPAKEQFNRVIQQMNPLTEIYRFLASTKGIKMVKICDSFWLFGTCKILYKFAQPIDKVKHLFYTWIRRKPKLAAFR